MALEIDDTDLSDLLAAIQAAIEAGRGQTVTQRIPVWFGPRIVAWYTVQIQREGVEDVSRMQAH